MKKKRLKAKKLRNQTRRLTGTDSNSLKSANIDANVSDEELLAKARAEARERVEETSDDDPPSLEINFKRPTFTEQGGIESPGEAMSVESWRATAGDKTFLRVEGETLEAFKARVEDSLPIGGLPKLVVYWPDNSAATEPEASAPVTSRRQKSFIAGFTPAGGKPEAFQSTPGESEPAFTLRMRARWGENAQFGISSWPTVEPCPYTRSLALVEETAERLKLVQ
jgi:hypothetical protein